MDIAFSLLIGALYECLRTRANSQHLSKSGFSKDRTIKIERKEKEKRKIIIIRQAFLHVNYIHTLQSKGDMLRTIHVSTVI